MEASKDIAGLIGPALMVLSLSEYLNFYIWAKVEATVVYLNGLLLFIAGLAIIRSHSTWTGDWTLLITVIGWISLTLGLYRTFFPAGRQMGKTPFTYIIFAATFIAGCFLTAKAYL